MIQQIMSDVIMGSIVRNLRLYVPIDAPKYTYTLNFIVLSGYKMSLRNSISRNIRNIYKIEAKYDIPN